MVVAAALAVAVVAVVAVAEPVVAAVVAVQLVVKSLFRKFVALYIEQATSTLVVALVELLELAAAELALAEVGALGSVAAERMAVAAIGLAVSR